MNFRTRFYTFTIYICMYVLAGSYGEVSRKYDGILEYDITLESYKEIATMTQARTHHAASVVPYETFSKWCQ